MGVRHPFDTATFKLVHLSPANPAEGAFYTIPLAVNCRFELVSACFSLATDVTPVDRFVTIAPRNAGVIHQNFWACRAINANAAADYAFYRGNIPENSIAALPGRINGTFGVGVILDNIDDIIITALGLQAGDTLSALHLYYKEWIQGTFPV
jgi:hypothetical protein